jgi:CBS domain-containing protein
MTIATQSVVTASLTTSVYDIVRIMTKEGFRRIPIVDPGTKKLQGIVTSTDVVNYLGGGEKFQIIQRKYRGSFFKAINEPVKSIIQPNPPSINTAASIGEAVRLMKQRNVGGLPVVDNTNTIWRIVTERDILGIFKGKISGTKVAEFMTKNVVTATPRTTVFEAERAMIEKSFRRLPVVSEGKLAGIVTTMDVVRFFGSSEVFHHLRSETILQVLQTPALEIGTRNVITTFPKTDLGEAARVMDEKNIGALLVVEGERLVGIITERDFFKLVSK